jgi:CubicO group peptidase (beta-lactamase class C family)
MVESTRPRIKINAERYGPLYYGYQWWLGRSLLSGHELPLIAAFGNGGQRLFVVPELDLVVAINAAHYGSLLQALIPAAILNQFVLPAVNDYSSHSE